ncbi:hypothetical protein, partial [Campylobacter canadensis]|uniref:hypothetical protein n=1 Tax=Campylobacter canadensis TaxID=449520 RepID=UPI0037BF799D|nr:hypothetical protein [Campylobacter canadensis]
MIQNYKKLLKDNFAKQIAKTFIDITTSSMSAFLDSSKDKISLYIIDDNTTEFKNFCCYDEKTSTYEIFITKPNYTTIKNIFMFDKTIEVNGKKITPLDDMESTYLLISKQILMHEFNHIKISNVKNLSQINKKLKQDGINPIWLNIFEDVRVNTFNDKLPKYKYVLNQLIKIDKSYFAENASKEEIMFSICISLNKYKAYEYANTTHYDYCVDIFNKIKNAKTISQTIDLLYEFFKKNINNKLNNSENMNKNNSNEDNTNNNMTNNKDNSYFDDNFDEDNTDNMTNNKDNSYFDEDDISKMNNNYFEQMSEDICEETIEKIKQTSIKIDDELIQKIKNIHANIDSENVIYAKPIKKTFTYNANNNYDTLLPTEYSCFEDETQKKLYSHTVKHLKNFFTNGFKQSSKQTNKLNMEKLHTLPYNKTLTNMFLTKEKNIADIKQTFFIDCSGSMTGL